MKNHLNLVVGLLFVLVGGLMYTFERLGAHVHWVGEVITTEYPTVPPMPSIFDNLFIPFFLLIGISFIIANSIKRGNVQ